MIVSSRRIDIVIAFCFRASSVRDVPRERGLNPSLPILNKKIFSPLHIILNLPLIKQKPLNRCRCI
jgi:hypothetical protein